jgi:hypothetical protein
MITSNIVRKPVARGRLGATRTMFEDNFVLHSNDDPFIPGTNVPRLRKIPLGERAVGFLDDEITAVIEGLRRFRDRQAASPPPRRRLARAARR